MSIRAAWSVGLLGAILLVAGCNTPTTSGKPVAPIPPPGTASRPHGPLTDEKTGLIFPADISRWIFSERRAYEPKALGVSYSYKSKLQRVGAITCSIYDRGAAAIPTGGDSEIVQREIAETVMGVVAGAQQRGAEATEIMGISALKKSDGRALALISAHRLIENGVTNISLSAVTGYKGQFVKIRFTFPGNDLDAALTGLGGLGEFVGEMRALNKATLDPLFLAESGNSATTR